MRGSSVAMLVILLGAGVASAQPAESIHHGVTVEAGLGADFTQGNGIYSFAPRFAPVVSAGVGGWLTQRTALTGRAFALKSGNVEAYRSYLLFVGMAFQYWVHPRLWIGYGAGYGQLTEVELPPELRTTYRGFVLDGRIGTSLTVASDQTVNISLELGAGLLPVVSGDPAEPGPAPPDYDPAPFFSLTLAVGYQYL